MNKKIIAFSVQIFIILLSVLVAVFLISVPYEASLIKVVIPTSPSQFSYMIKNGTLYIQTNSLIINNGFYDLNDLSLFISVYTLSNFQIAYLYLGFPYQHIVISNACVSSGTIYVYLEPYNVKASLIIVGDTPVANFLIKLANLFDFQTIHVGKEANEEAYENVNYNDIDKFTIPDEAFIVIATSMSSSNIAEEKLIEFFLKKHVSYIGIVASKRRASALKNLLIKKGYSKELVSKIRSPAGISLGSSLNYKEIALSIITEIIGIKKGGNFMPIEELEEMRNEENFIDPVCGMVVSKDTYKLIYGNVEYRFCSKVCLEKFMLTPLKFLNQVK